MSFPDLLVCHFDHAALWMMKKSSNFKYLFDRVGVVEVAVAIIAARIIEEGRRYVDVQGHKPLHPGFPPFNPTRKRKDKKT